MTLCDRRGDVVQNSQTVLSSIYLNPTRYCNLRCRHCWVSPPYSEELSEETGELSVDEMIGIVKEARPLGLTSLKLTGGEPLLRAGLERLLEFCSVSGIEVWIETNGTLVTERMARMFKELGVSDISVSLDSPVEERHDHFRGKKGAFAEAVRGIKHLVDAGLGPEVIMSLYRENIRNFGSFLGLMTGLGVRRVKINTISPVGRGESLYGTDLVPDIKEILDFYGELRTHYAGFDGFIFLDIPMAFKGLDDIKGGRCSICGIKNIIGVLSDGSISMCGIGFLNEKLIFGNLKDDPAAIKDIWKSSPMLQKIREGVPSKLEGICGMCVLKNMCLGDCRAEVFHNTGSVTAPYWFCQEAYDSGLFPSTRLMPRTEKV